MEEGSRTAKLDSQLIEDLSSPDSLERFVAIEDLPEGLSCQEIADVSSQVSMPNTPMEIIRGTRLQRQVIFDIGQMALYGKEDLVTAHNAKHELLNRLSLINYYYLNYMMRRETQKIIREIMTP